MSLHTVGTQIGNPGDIDSGDESDGRNALRNVEAREQSKAARRGPSNASMQHFHEPTPVEDRTGNKRWEIIQTVTHICLAKYRIPESLNLHIRCVCHVINLVVQTILAALGEADDPNDIDYYALNKEQPLHLDIDTDPEQHELDEEQFPKEMDEDEDENIILEEEEKLKAMASPLAKLHQITIKIVSTPQRR